MSKVFGLGSWIDQNAVIVPIPLTKKEKIEKFMNLFLFLRGRVGREA